MTTTSTTNLERTCGFHICLRCPQSPGSETARRASGSRGPQMKKQQRIPAPLYSAPRSPYGTAFHRTAEGATICVSWVTHAYSAFTVAIEYRLSESTALLAAPLESMMNVQEAVFESLHGRPYYTLMVAWYLATTMVHCIMKYQDSNVIIYIYICMFNSVRI